MGPPIKDAPQVRRQREVRKAIDREHSARAPAPAQAIKLADLIDNTASIERHIPEFAKVYAARRRYLSMY